MCSTSSGAVLKWTSFLRKFPLFSRQLILLIVTSRLSRDGAISPQDKEGKKSAQVNVLFYVVVFLIYSAKNIEKHFKKAQTVKL